MKIKFILPALVLIATIGCNQPQNANNNNTPQITENNEPKDSGVYFVNLKNGDTVKSPIIVQMGVKGKTVEPAGALNAGKGHHHLIIDGSFIEKGQMVMKDSTHLHFGKGQTVDTLKLSPGQHTLTLQFADGTHMSYGKDWSSTITIFVKQ
jgi:hypothetical protein